MVNSILVADREGQVRRSFMMDSLPVKKPEECIGEIEFELTDFLNDKIHKREIND